MKHYAWLIFWIFAIANWAIYTIEIYRETANVESIHFATTMASGYVTFRMTYYLCIEIVEYLQYRAARRYYAK